MSESGTEEKPINKLLVLLISAVLAGAGGNLGIRAISDPRPDPFTGTEARQLEERLKWRMDRIERQNEEMYEHIHNHDRASEEWKRRIILIEERIRNGRSGS